MKQELAKPRYGGYWLCTCLGSDQGGFGDDIPGSMADREDFSNVLSKGQIEDMAGADELEVVKEVQVRSDLKRTLVLGMATDHAGVLCRLSRPIPITLHLDASGTSRWRGWSTEREHTRVYITDHAAAFIPSESPPSHTAQTITSSKKHSRCPAKPEEATGHTV